MKNQNQTATPCTCATCTRESITPPTGRQNSEVRTYANLHTRKGRAAAPAHIVELWERTAEREKQHKAEVLRIREQAAAYARGCKRMIQDEAKRPIAAEYARQRKEQVARIIDEVCRREQEHEQQRKEEGATF